MILNYVQHISPEGQKFFLGGLRPSAPPGYRPTWGSAMKTSLYRLNTIHHRIKEHKLELLPMACYTSSRPIKFVETGCYISRKF